MRDNSMQVHQNDAEPWRVTLVDTGAETQTGGRLKRVGEYIGDETFCFTYGDGVADVDIASAGRVPPAHGKLATVTAVQPPGRFGALEIDDDAGARGFLEKPLGDGGWINGGFFVLSAQRPRPHRRRRHALGAASRSRASRTTASWWPSRTRGFWQPMDTLRDKNLLEELWDSGNGAVEVVATRRSRAEFWRGRRVFVTGHTGFKGSLARAVAARSWARRSPATRWPPDRAEPVRRSPDSARRRRAASATFATRPPSRRVRAAARPEIVSTWRPRRWCGGAIASRVETFATNVMGTVNVLEAAAHAPTVRAVVVVTSDKSTRTASGRAPSRGRPARRPRPVQRQQGVRRARRRELSRELLRDGGSRGRDRARRQRHRRRRLGAGPAHPGLVRALVTPASRALRNPEAVRPWQHVLEPLSGYLRLAERLWQAPRLAGACNFGPRTDEAARSARSSRLAQRAPCGGRIAVGATNRPGRHEAGPPRARDRAARDVLDVAPRWTLPKPMRRTVAWYARLAEGVGRALCSTRQPIARPRESPFTTTRVAVRDSTSSRTRRSRTRGASARLPLGDARGFLSRLFSPTSCATPLGTRRRAGQPTPGRRSAAAFADCTSSGRRTPSKSSSTVCAAKSSTSPSTCGAARRPSCAGTPSGWAATTASRC